MRNLYTQQITGGVGNLNTYQIPTYKKISTESNSKTKAMEKEFEELKKAIETFMGQFSTAELAVIRKAIEQILPTEPKSDEPPTIDSAKIREIFQKFKQPQTIQSEGSNKFIKPNIETVDPENITAG